MIESVDDQDKFRIDGPVTLGQFDRGMLDVLWIALARRDADDRESASASIAFEDDGVVVSDDEGCLDACDEAAAFALVNLASIWPRSRDAVRSYRIGNDHASSTMRCAALSTLEERAAEAAQRLHGLLWSNRRHAAAKAVAEALPDGVRDRACAPFARHMTDAVSAARMGFHFEEGGCWGMALALRDHFASNGQGPVIRIGRVGGRDSHAYVQVGCLAYDHSGPMTWQGPSAAVSVQQLLRRARLAGYDRGDVEADRIAAAGVIEDAAERGRASP